MDTEGLISLLRCPSCRSEVLDFHGFCRDGTRYSHGVVRCRACAAAYPLENDLLELLPPALRYEEDWKRFSDRWRHQLNTVGVRPDPPPLEGSALSGAQALGQQKHFDWYAENPVQSYSDYERSSFWRAADEIAFGPWRTEIRRRAEAGKVRVLDVGCAQGRSTFHLADIPVEILAFDISKSCIQMAADRIRVERPRASMTFLCADATGFPFRDESLDVVLVYGVLHHVEDPASVCREIGRVLRPGGVYFGQENNTTVFRWIFDLLQRFRPAWYEEAGPEALISESRLRGWLGESGMNVSTRTSVFLPPHLLNLLSVSNAQKMLRVTDCLAQRVPGLFSNGGVVVFRAEKSQAAPRNTPRPGPPS